MRWPGPASAGIHRIAWELDYAPVGNGFRGGGPPVTPGTYQVEVAKRVDDVTTSLGDPMTFEVVSISETGLPRPDAEQTLQFQLRAAELFRAAKGAESKTDEVLTQLTAINEAIRKSRKVGLGLLDEGRKIELGLKNVRDVLFLPMAAHPTIGA